MNPLIFNLNSEAYYHPGDEQQFSLKRIILVYPNVHNGKIKLCMNGKSMRYIINRSFSINDKHYKVVISHHREAITGTIEIFRIGGYLPYVMKEEYTFDPNCDGLIDRYVDILSQFELAKNELIDGVNCIIVYGNFLSIHNKLITDRSQALYVNNEVDLNHFNPNIHRIIVFNVDCQQLTGDEILRLTRISNRQYRSITFPDDIKFIFLPNCNGVIFTGDLDHVGQLFRIIRVNPPLMEHQLVTINE